MRHRDLEEYGELRNFDPVDALGKWIAVRLRKAAQMNVFGPMGPRDRKRVLRSVEKSLMHFSKKRYKANLMRRFPQTNMETQVPRKTMDDWVHQANGKTNGKLELEMAEGGD